MSVQLIQHAVDQFDDDTPAIKMAVVALAAAAEGFAAIAAEPERAVEIATKGEETFRALTVTISLLAIEEAVAE
jgi:hypothetical protein